MAQLRDKKTSELVAEGTPLAVVLLADELGRDEVLFDDVGLDFDPDAVLAAHNEHVDNLKLAAGAAKNKADKDAAAAARSAAVAEAEAARELVEEAAKRLDAARQAAPGAGA